MAGFVHISVREQIPPLLFVQGRDDKASGVALNAT